MTNYINDDMTFSDICSAVLTEYKEPVAGSNAIALDYVEDVVNTVYYDIFNMPELRGYTTEGEYTFASKDNQQVGTGGVLASAITLLLDDTSTWGTSGSACINKQDFFAFTGNVTATDTLTGVTGIQVDHDEGEGVELGYSLPTDIDGQKVRGFKVGGLDYNFAPDTQYFSNFVLTQRSYTISKSKIYVGNPSADTVTMFYDVKLTTLTGTEKPTLIPGRFRPALLISGAVERVGVRDDMRTGWDWHKNRYELNLARFIATVNNPIRKEHPSYRPSIYD